MAKLYISTITFAFRSVFGLILVVFSEFLAEIERNLINKI